MSRLDLLVIGGGINGLGIAADAAARGLAVLLVEKGDFGGATTAASSRLIHGGLRYLQYGEWALVRESLRERGILVRQRPHRVRPMQLLIPSYRGGPVPPWMLGAGLALYGLLASDPFFPLPGALTAARTRHREPGLDPDGLWGGFLYPDAQIEFPERLCVELRAETLAAGGQVLNHTRVTALNTAGGRVTGAHLRDELDGREWDVDAALTINAAGPWVDAVNALLPEPPPRLIGGTRGTHLVLPCRPEGPQGPLYANARRDGRPFFLLPWDRRLLVGTTDRVFEGDPDTLRAEDWEVEYLLEETNHLFPGARYAGSDVEYVTAGIRPLPASDRSAAAITRRHFLVDHAARHGIAGLASVVGGKLTTYRSLSEEVVDWALRTLGKAPVACPTRRVRMGERENGGLGEGGSARSKGEPSPRIGGGLGGGLSEAAQDRLQRVYPPAVIASLTADPTETTPLAPGSPVLRDEIAHAIREEGARTADDVLLRRLMRLPPGPGEREEVEGLLAKGDTP